MKHEKFINALAAMTALHMMTIWYASQGVVITSNVNLEQRNIRLTVYMQNKVLKTPPESYYYTLRILSSNWYYSPITQKNGVIRTMEYYFEY